MEKERLLSMIATRDGKRRRKGKKRERKLNVREREQGEREFILNRSVVL